MPITGNPALHRLRTRINAVKQAHARGTPTWISLEPVIEPGQALALIREIHLFVGHWKVGKINHSKEIEDKHDWLGFREQVVALLKSVGADYYIKNSLNDHA